MNPRRRYSVRINSGSRSIVAIDGFEVPQNGVTFLFGESGIGKSMICKAIYGLLDPDQLDITVNGTPYVRYLAEPTARALADNSFFVFQEPSSHLNPLMRISEQLSEGALHDAPGGQEVLQRLWHGAGDDAIKRIIDVYPKPYRPSGGEKQRVLLAMAFKKINRLNEGGGEPNFFVFDEPTGSLDNNYRNLFLRLLFEKFAARPFTAMVITHDYSIISEVFARYKPLLPHIHYKELSRTDSDMVRLDDFSPEDYLGWLKGVRPPSTGHSAADPVVTLDSTFQVFGRTLRIYRDAAHTQPCQMVIRRGELVYVKAPSGVGKTTLAKVIMGLYPASKLTMRIAQKAVTERTPRHFWPREIWGRKAGMVFQHADEALNLEATVRETFDGLPLDHRLTIDELKSRLGELFEGDVSDSFLRKKVKYLSGGQKQRLNLLRTLILATDLTILDEPLNALDFVSVKKVLAIIDQKRAKGAAQLMISHNEEIFDSMVDAEHLYYLAEVK